MNTAPNRCLFAPGAIIAVLSLIFSACTPQPTSPLASTPTRTDTPPNPAPTAAMIPLPQISLEQGNHYFSVDGKQQPVFSRNIAAYTMDDFNNLLPMTHQGGSQLVRLQVSTVVAGGKGFTSTGQVDEAWARKWDRVFETAAANGVYIWVVFSGWYDWNTTGYNDWANNPFNAANGGPAKEPAELFDPASQAQKLWLEWLNDIVGRWQRHKNILVWEFYSEVNLTQGVSEENGVAFIEKAAAVTRAADPARRLITNSLADIGEWDSFYRSQAVDFINIHPYPPSAQLDRVIVADVRRVYAAYQKPVMIGESGLSAETPDKDSGKLTVAEHASRGVHHAIWAAAVSGAMNGRALYWEDGYGLYFPGLSWNFLKKYTQAEFSAASFVSQIDFAGFQPLEVDFLPGTQVWGAASGSEHSVVGWFRDATCEPPDWPLLPVVSGQAVTIHVPGSVSAWKVDFYDTQTGAGILASAAITAQDGKINLSLPDFKDDIAFKMTALEEAVSPSAPVITTDSLAGKWKGTITNSSGTFTTLLELEFQTGCVPGQACGWFSVPELPCSGDLFLDEVEDETFVFVEQNVTGASSCTSGGLESLRLLPDGTLEYNFAFSPGASHSSSGILVRR